jgi:hypothetical protein
VQCFLRFSAAAVLLLCASRLALAEGNDAFATTVKPVLMQNCSGCHNPANPKNRLDFLKASTADDMNSRRGLWRSVAEQLRNRTMPPAASKLTDDDRLRISNWIDDRLRQTACSTGNFAGGVTIRRLNRREYRNTLRDLLGVELPVAEIFPADGSGGEGFDTHGGTLYVPPLMMERYLEAAQQAVDRAIITPAFNKNFSAFAMEPLAQQGARTRPLSAGEALKTTFSTFADGDYNVRVWIDRPKDRERFMLLTVNGNPAGKLVYQRDPAGGPTARALTVKLARGVHKIELTNGDIPVEMYNLSIDQKVPEPLAEKRVTHYRLFGTEPGEAPAEPRKAAERLLTKFIRSAYRRPADAATVSRLMTMYDRAAERGDPYEERVKLALKTVLVSPAFLFQIETGQEKPGIFPIGQHELATRLSYFLWASTPDEELLRLADEGKLQDAKVLAAQVDRMLDDPRSRAFANSFVGQWLGTKDIGGRVAPLITEVQHYYTPEVAADLREEPILLFQHLLGQNRSLIELLTADYTFMTERLANFYGYDGQITGLSANSFQKVTWPDNRRAGVLGLAGVLALSSHFKQTSPVLRGAWVLETLLGTHVPLPPPDIPPLDVEPSKIGGLTMRQKLVKHRENPACASCHNVMDLIGFGLENFDWLGRWREQDAGQKIDAAGVMASGEKFDGPAELRQVLLNRKDDFIRTLTGKVLGYALGRSLEDGDQCTIQKLVATLAKDDYKARTLIREVVLSTPFRNVQGGVVTSETISHAPVRKQKAPTFK